MYLTTQSTSLRAALLVCLPLLVACHPFLYYINHARQGYGRNIQPLPCATKEGDTGVCMFAWDCMKANGTHLGTCIERFYFGSCCKLKPGSQKPVHTPMKTNVYVLATTNDPSSAQAETESVTPSSLPTSSIGVGTVSLVTLPDPTPGAETHTTASAETSTSLPHSSTDDETFNVVQQVQEVFPLESSGSSSTGDLDMEAIEQVMSQVGTTLPEYQVDEDTDTSGQGESGITQAGTDEGQELESASQTGGEDSGPGVNDTGVGEQQTSDIDDAQAISGEALETTNEIQETSIPAVGSQSSTAAGETQGINEESVSNNEESQAAAEETDGEATTAGEESQPAAEGTDEDSTSTADISEGTNQESQSITDEQEEIIGESELSEYELQGTSEDVQGTTEGSQIVTGESQGTSSETQITDEIEQLPDGEPQGNSGTESQSTATETDEESQGSSDAESTVVESVSSSHTSAETADNQETIPELDQNIDETETEEQNVTELTVTSSSEIQNSQSVDEQGDASTSETASAATEQDQEATAGEGSGDDETSTNEVESSSLPSENEDQAPAAVGEASGEAESSSLPSENEDQSPAAVGEATGEAESSSLPSENEDQAPAAVGEPTSEAESSSLPSESEDQAPAAVGEAEIETTPESESDQALETGSSSETATISSVTSETAEKEDSDDTDVTPVIIEGPAQSSTDINGDSITSSQEVTESSVDNKVTEVVSSSETQGSENIVEGEAEGSTTISSVDQEITVDQDETDGSGSGDIVLEASTPATVEEDQSESGLDSASSTAGDGNQSSETTDASTSQQTETSSDNEQSQTPSSSQSPEQADTDSLPGDESSVDKPDESVDLPVEETDDESSSDSEVDNEVSQTPSESASSTSSPPIDDNVVVPGIQVVTNPETSKNETSTEVDESASDDSPADTETPPTEKPSEGSSEAVTPDDDGNVVVGIDAQLPNVTIDKLETQEDQLLHRLNTSSYKDICGQPVYPSRRIVGGSQASFGEWPWQVSLRQWRSVTYLHKCGAALVNENWAITAAHCVENVQPDQVLLRLGEYDLERTDEPYGHVERKVQIIATHPQFDPRTFEYDLALLRFNEPVNFQPNIIPICIPEDDYDFIGDTGFVSGWGRLYEDGPLPSLMQKVPVPVITNAECEVMYRNAGYIEDIPNIFICAGYEHGKRDSCEGDSGGPLVIQHKNSWQLAGVISWGIGCALPNQPGVYTRISAFRTWINKIVVF